MIYKIAQHNGVIQSYCKNNKNEFMTKREVNVSDTITKYITRIDSKDGLIPYESRVLTDITRTGYPNQLPRIYFALDFVAEAVSVAKSISGYINIGQPDLGDSLKAQYAGNILAGYIDLPASTTDASYGDARVQYSELPSEIRNLFSPAFYNDQTFVVYSLAYDPQEIAASYYYLLVCCEGGGVQAILLRTRSLLGTLSGYARAISSEYIIEQSTLLGVENGMVSYDDPNAAIIEAVDELVAQAIAEQIQPVIDNAIEEVADQATEEVIMNAFKQFASR